LPLCRLNSELSQETSSSSSSSSSEYARILESCHFFRCKYSLTPGAVRPSLLWYLMLAGFAGQLVPSRQFSCKTIRLEACNLVRSSASAAVSCKVDSMCDGFDGYTCICASALAHSRTVRRPANRYRRLNSACHRHAWQCVKPKSVETLHGHH